MSIDPDSETGPHSTSPSTPLPDRLRKGRDQDLYDRAERALDTPMILLALSLGVIICVQWMAELSTGTDRTLTTIGWFIWALFVCEFLVLLWLAPNKKKMVRTHWIDVILILAPFLRPLRVLRLLRVLAAFGAVTKIGRRIFARQGLQWTLLVVLGLIVGGAALTQWFERDEASSAIDSFGDALWWGIVTCTTVGYGDAFPVSPGGRAVAIVLMIVGVGLLSIITASVASVFVEIDAEDDAADLHARLDELNTKLDAVLAELGAR